MNLPTYVRAQGGTATLNCPVIAQIASKANCSASTLYMIAKGHKQASPLLAKEIELATEGQVSRKQLRPDVFGEPPAADDSEAA